MADREFLDKILTLSSPTGAEQNLQRYIADWAKPFADKIEADLVGNMAVVINPESHLRIMLVAHCDQIGFMVMEITDEGLLKVEPLGGIDEGTVLGSRINVRTAKGNVKGVFGKVSTHLEPQSDKKEVKTIDHMWIDIGAKNRQEAESMVEIGDYAVYEPRIVDLGDSRIAAPALDNMCGLYAIMQTAKNCAEREIDAALYCVSSVQEEIGSRGAFTVGNTIKAYIAVAVDTTLAADTPGKLNSDTAPKIRLEAGPTILSGPNGNPGVRRLLKEAAKKADIPYQVEIVTKKASNDASELQIADGGTAAGSVGIPLRNMHTQVEVVSLKDLDDTVKLLTEFVCSVKQGVDLLPLHMDSRGKSVAKITDRIGLGIEGKQF